MAFYRAPKSCEVEIWPPWGLAEDPAKMPGLGSMQGGAMESALRDFEASWPAPPQDYCGIDLPSPYVMLLRDYCPHIRELRCRWLPGASLENPH